ncbi:MAG: hypothetical protein AAF542_21770 [Pseudomonadota bacterium]
MTPEQHAIKDAHETDKAPGRGFWRSIGHFLLLCMADDSGNRKSSSGDPTVDMIQLGQKAYPDAEDDLADWQLASSYNDD